MFMNGHGSAARLQVVPQLTIGPLVVHDLVTPCLMFISPRPETKTRRLTAVAGKALQFVYCSML